MPPPSQTVDPDPQTASLFLGLLPLELRLAIYELIFASTRFTHGILLGYQRLRPRRHGLALLRVCRRIRREIGDDMWLGQCLFSFSDPAAMLDKLTPLPKTTLSKIRHLRVHDEMLKLERPRRRVSATAAAIGGETRSPDGDNEEISIIEETAANRLSDEEGEEEDEEVKERRNFTLASALLLLSPDLQLHTLTVTSINITWAWRTLDTLIRKTTTTTTAPTTDGCSNSSPSRRDCHYWRHLRFLSAGSAWLGCHDAGFGPDAAPWLMPQPRTWRDFLQQRARHPGATVEILRRARGCDWSGTVGAAALTRTHEMALFEQETGEGRGGRRRGRDPALWADDEIWKETLVLVSLGGGGGGGCCGSGCGGDDDDDEGTGAVVAGGGGGGGVDGRRRREGRLLRRRKCDMREFVGSDDWAEIREARSGDGGRPVDPVDGVPFWEKTAPRGDSYGHVDDYDWEPWTHGCGWESEDDNWPSSSDEE